MRSTVTTTLDQINTPERVLSQVVFKWNALKGFTLALNQVILPES